jgi:hypothetical protein
MTERPKGKERKIKQQESKENKPTGLQTLMICAPPGTQIFGRFASSIAVMPSIC